MYQPAMRGGTGDMFHIKRNRGPRKHVMGIIIDLYGATLVHTCKNEVIIERVPCIYYEDVFNKSQCNKILVVINKTAFKRTTV